MRSNGTADGLNRHERKPLMRSSVLLVALLFLLATAKAQPVSYDFNNGLGKAWRVAQWKSPDSKVGLNHGTYVPEHVDFVEGMLRLKVEQTQGSDGVISKGAAVWTREKFGSLKLSSEGKAPFRLKAYWPGRAVPVTRLSAERRPRC